MHTFKNEHAAEPVASRLPHTGFIRLSTILAPLGPIPVGRSTWWAGVKSGRFPKPVKLGPRTTAWKVEDIRKLIESAE
jgi:prophage regulatory protein